LRTHESPFEVPGGFPSHEDADIAPAASEWTIAGFPTSGFRPAVLSRSMLASMSPREQRDSNED
jgi:hypothetical protein